MKAIVVSFDHLPVGFLGLYGNTWVDTPSFDRLASEGVVFDRHLAAAVGPVEGVPHAWSAERGAEARRDGESLVARLELAGVRTTLILEEPGDSTRSMPAPQGFGEILAVAGQEGLEAVPAETPFQQAVLRAARWLAEAPEEDWLLWVKSCGVPSPWIPPREQAERYVPLFEELEDDPDWSAEQAVDDEFEWLVPADEDEDDGEENDPGAGAGADEDEPLIPAAEESVAAEEPIGDEEVGAEEDWLDEAQEFDELLVMLGSVGVRESTQGLETSDWLLVRAVYGGYVALLDEGLGALRRAIAESVGDDVLLIVTGGEGESLGERAELPNAWAALGEEVVHTPLLLAGPNVQAGSRRSDLVQTIDVAPTLLEWFGVDVAAAGGGVDGRSLLPSARGGPAFERKGVVVVRDPDFAALRTPDWYLVVRRSPQGEERWLFAKPEDVWDLHDVSAQEPATTEELASLLRTLLSEDSAKGTGEIEGRETSHS